MNRLTNKNYVKDDGEEMLSILKNKQYEESRDRWSINECFLWSERHIRNYWTFDQKSLPAELFSADFTKVLDSAYNAGDPRNRFTVLKNLKELGNVVELSDVVMKKL